MAELFLRCEKYTTKQYNVMDILFCAAYIATFFSNAICSYTGGLGTKLCNTINEHPCVGVCYYFPGHLFAKEGITLFDPTELKF